MLDLTVIEGGGQPIDFQTEAAKDAFRRFVIAILRTLGRGDGSGYKACSEFIEFLKSDAEAKVSTNQIMNTIFREMEEDALREDADQISEIESNDRAILRSSVRLIAESLAQDPAAKGRRSMRKDEFRRIIETGIVDREERARKNGRSYIDSLTKHLPKIPPAPPRSKTTRRSSSKRKPPI